MKKFNSLSVGLPFFSCLFIASLFVLFSSFLVSCRSGQPGKSGPFHIRVEFDEQISLEEIEKHISSFEVVPIEYSKGNEMGRISKIAGNKDRIAIYIRKNESFWILDYRGKILEKINKRGKGPGEYNGVAFITFSPVGNLVLVDPAKMVLLEYSLDGKMVSELNISENFGNVEYLGRQTLVFGSYRVQEKEQVPGNYINIFNLGYVPEKQLLPFYTSWPMGGIAPDLIRRGNKIGITKVGDYSYYELDEDRNLDTLLVFDFGENGYDFTHSDRMEYKDFIQIWGQNLEKPISAGYILPQDHKFLADNMFKGVRYFGIGAWNQSSMVYRPVLDFKIIGSYRGFPVPGAREIVNGNIAGSLEAIDILDFWEKYPDEKARAEKEPEFDRVISQLDADDNPLLIFFTLGK